MLEFLNVDTSMNLFADEKKSAPDVPTTAKVVNLTQITGNIKLVYEAIEKGEFTVHVVCNHSFDDADIVRTLPMKERMDCLLGVPGAPQSASFPKVRIPQRQG